MNSLIAQWKSLCGTIWSAALSKWSSFRKSTCLSNALISMPTSALLNKGTIQINHSPYVMIWAQVCPDTDLALGKNASIYNLVLSCRSSWDSRSVQYCLYDATSSFNGDVISSWGIMSFIWSNHCGNCFNAVGKIFTASMERFLVALWRSNTISKVKGLEKSLNSDAAWIKYLFLFSTDYTLKYNVDGSHSVLWDTVTLLHIPSPLELDDMSIGIKRLSSIANPQSR